MANFGTFMKKFHAETKDNRLWAIPLSIVVTLDLKAQLLEIGGLFQTVLNIGVVETQKKISQNQVFHQKKWF